MDETTLEPESLLDDLSWLRALARRLIQDPDLAEDAVQDTLVKAMTRRPQGGSIRSLRAWLGSILRNEVRQEQRSRGRRSAREARLERPGNARATVDIVAELSLHRRLVELVHELKEPQRTAVALRYLRGRTPRQIAHELEVPVKTVHSRIDRGLAQLRIRLDREFDGERGAWVAVFAPVANRWALPLGLGPLVIPINMKLIAAGLGLAALGALAYFPLRPRSKPVEQAAAPPSIASGLVHAEPAELSGVSVSPGDRRAEPVESADLGALTPRTEPERITFDGEAREMDGRPVGGLAIVFEAEQEGSFVRDDELPAVRTAANGAFTFPLPEERGRLDVAGGEYASVLRPFLEGTPPVESPTVVVAPRRAYAGRVIDEAGRPVANARVEVSLDGLWIQSYSVGESPLHFLLPFAEQRTNAFGEFRFDGLGFVAGAHLEALRDGFESARVVLPSESAFELELVLAREVLDQPAVHGRVVDANGNGVGDALVSLGSDSLRSGADGRFALELETWQESGNLRAFKPGHMPAVAFFDRAGGEGADPEHPLILDLGDRPLSIRGRVLDADGEPAAGVTVFTPDTTHFGRALIESGEDSTLGEVTVEELLADSCGPEDGWRLLTTRTDTDGHFELDGLLARDYALFALRPDLSAAGPSKIEAGSSGVELVLEATPRTTVAGRVVSRGGLPIAGARISLGRSLEWERPPERFTDSWNQSSVLPPGAGTLFPPEPGAVTAADGLFELADVVVVDGTFLSLRSPAILLGGHHRFDPAEDLEHLEIEVEARCEFRVVLDDPAEADAVACHDEADEIYPLFVRVEDSTISMPAVAILEGRSGVVQIGEGAHTLVLLKDGEEVRRGDVTFVPGGLQEVRIAP